MQQNETNFYAAGFSRSAKPSAYENLGYREKYKSIYNSSQFMFHLYMVQNWIRLITIFMTSSYRSYEQNQNNKCKFE